MKYKLYKTSDNIVIGDKVVYHHLSRNGSLIVKKIHQIVDDNIYVKHGEGLSMMVQMIKKERIHGFIKKKWYDFLID